MRWHSIILIAGVFLVVESAKHSHEKKSHFTSIEDEEEKEDNEHLFDVKKIVKGTIDAIGGQGTTPKPDGLYQLFQIPSEILTQIASDAGYIEPSTTVVPKRKKKRRNHKAKKYRKVSEDGSYEGTYVRVEDEEEDDDEDAYKPRKKKKSKRRHHSPIYLSPNYVPPPMVSSPPLQQSLRTHQIPHQDPPVGVPIQPIRRQELPQADPLTSIFAPLPSFSLPTVPMPTFAPLTLPPTTTVSPPTMAPLSIRPLEQSASPLADSSSAGPQYAYQPVVQADGKTYYQRVLILPPTRAGDPAPEVIMPTQRAVTTTTTEASTTTKGASNSFVVEESTTTTTEEPTSTEGTKRKTKIRRRLIKNKNEKKLPAEAIQQLPQSDPVSTTMRPVTITFSSNLELFQTTAPSEEVTQHENREVKIKPRTHGTRTHSVGKAIESGDSIEGLTTAKPALRYVKEEEKEESEEETTSSSIPTPPVPAFTPKLLTTQLPSIEDQMKNNEVFSVSLETAKKGSGTLSAPQVTSLHSIANRRLQEENYLPPIEEKKRGKKKGRKEKKEKKEERVKKVESNEIDDIKEAVEAVRREKKEKVQRRFHQEEEKREEEEKEIEKEDEEEEENVTTTQKPRRRHHKKKSHRAIELEAPKKISLAPPEDETEESSIPPATPSSSSFRRSLAPALIDVRKLNESPRTTSPSIRHVHHAERLAVLRKSLEARARGVKQLSTQEKEEEDEEDEKNEVTREGEESAPLPDPFPSTTTEIAKKKKTRRHRKRKTTVAPSTTTTTTTTETPTTTEEKEEESYELEEEYEEGDLSFEIDDDGDKVVKKKTAKRERVTTTTTKPSSTSSPSKKLKVLRPHCLNIRSFARQFGMVDVFEFVDEHCSFIENYYPSLTCERREEYLSFCAEVWDSTKL